MNYIIENKYKVISEQGSKGQQEKYYRNGFVDGSQLVMGCFDE